MARPHNYFSDAQMEELRSSIYVRSVARNAVYFTDEFKHIYWQMYENENLMPYEILRQLGISYHLLGSARVRGLTRNIMLQNTRNGVPCEKHKKKAASQSVYPPTHAQFARLQAENEYLKQELDFVKKILVSGTEEKR